MEGREPAAAQLAIAASILRMSIARKLRIVLAVGLFSAVTATVISSVLLASYLAFTNSFLGVREGLRYAALLSVALCTATAPFAMSFGLLAGCALGALLTVGGLKLSSNRQILAACMAVGTLLSLTFPFFHAEMHQVALSLWRTGRLSDQLFRYVAAWPAFLSGSRELLFAIAVGVPCAVAAGILFGRAWRETTT